LPADIDDEVEKLVERRAYKMVNLERHLRLRKGKECGSNDERMIKPVALPEAGLNQDLAAYAVTPTKYIHQKFSFPALMLINKIFMEK
jgi:hypothetical protein